MAEAGASPSTAASRRGLVGVVRSPVAVILLSIITLGIYSLYWIYKSFQEMKDHTGEGVGGGLGLILGILLGTVVWFLLPRVDHLVRQGPGRAQPLLGVLGLIVGTGGSARRHMVQPSWASLSNAVPGGPSLSLDARTSTHCGGVRTEVSISRS